ncbi:nucleotidyltransferase family protein [Chloracidobacterium thermophilum]
MRKLPMKPGERLKAQREEILRIAARHGARYVRVFGSVIRGEADERSDIDFLVEDSALHPRQAEADQAARRIPSGPHPPGRHRQDRRPHRQAVPGLQGLRRPVAGPRAGAL